MTVFLSFASWAALLQEVGQKTGGGFQAPFTGTCQPWLIDLDLNPGNPGQDTRVKECTSLTCQVGLVKSLRGLPALLHIFVYSCFQWQSSKAPQ
jgi:hypothetical protein